MDYENNVVKNEDKEAKKRYCMQSNMNKEDR